MSDLTDAATNLSNAATRANKTTDFFDDVTTLGPTSTVKNPNNNKTVPSVQKQVKDLFDALPPTEEFTELESAALAAGTTYDNITYSTNLVDEVKGYILDASTKVTYTYYPKEVGVLSDFNALSMTAKIGGNDVYLINDNLGIDNATGWGLEVGESGSHEKNTFIMLDRISKYLSNEGGAMSFPNGRVNFGFQNPDTSNAPNSDYILWGEHSIHLIGAEKPIEISFQGTEFNFISNYRFGSFDPSNTGNPLDASAGGRFISCGDFFRINGCKSVIATGSATIKLNSSTAIKGGQAGDTGIQLSGTGVNTMANDFVELCPIDVQEAPLDGFSVGWNGLTESDEKKPVILHNPKSVICGRNNLSVVGSNSLVIYSPVFDKAGVGTFSSLPRSGIDFENEGGAPVKGIHIYNPYIKGSRGSCVLTPFNSAKSVNFYGGKLIAGEEYTLYGGFDGNSNFYNTSIVGPTVQQNGEHVFHDCLLSMDEADADGNALATSSSRMDMSLFSGKLIRCDIRANDDGTSLPSVSSKASVYDCELHSSSGARSFFRPTFYGFSTFDMTNGSDNDSNFSKYRGAVLYNGVNLGIEDSTFKRNFSAINASGKYLKMNYTTLGFSDSLFSGVEVNTGDRAYRGQNFGTHAGQVVTTAGTVGSTAIIKNYGAIE